jgi:hypothetical protein
VKSGGLSFAMQQKSPMTSGGKNFIGELFIPYYLNGEGGVRPVSRRAKWPGRHQRS